MNLFPSLRYSRRRLLAALSGLAACSLLPRKLWTAPIFANPAIPGAHPGAAFGDIDNDGKIDVVVTSLSGQVKLFRNVSNTGHHWILLRLVGTRSNRMGLGARVRITTPDGRSQWNEVTTAVGYACSSDLRVHFGLGENRTIAELEITWPSRAKQILRDVQVDRILTIEEPHQQVHSP